MEALLNLSTCIGGQPLTYRHRETPLLQPVCPVVCLTCLAELPYPCSAELLCPCPAELYEPANSNRNAAYSQQECISRVGDVDGEE